MRERLLMKLEANLKVQCEGFKGIYRQKLNIIFMLCFYSCIIIEKQELLCFCCLTRSMPCCSSFAFFASVQLVSVCDLTGRCH